MSYNKPLWLHGWPCVSLLALIVAGCSNSSDNSGPPPPSPPESTFNQFVLHQFAATADNTVPPEINGLTFTFSENPNAFDSLFD